MDRKTLLNAGLTNSQADAYQALVKHSPSTPPTLSKLISESRTNTYKLLEQLEELGLAERDESQKKLQYHAKSPDALMDLTRANLMKAEAANNQISANLESLRLEFYRYNQQPGVRFFQGRDALRQIYDDQIDTAQPVNYFRSIHDVKFFSYDEMRKLRGSFGLAGIKRHVFSPDARDVPINWQETDKIRLLERTWLKPELYTAPVEVAVYGNKVSMLSFDKEAVGTVIESPQIAEALRQIFELADMGAKSVSGYNNMPENAAVLITGSLEIGKGAHKFVKNKK